MVIYGKKTNYPAPPKSVGIFRWWGWLTRQQDPGIRALERRLKANLVVDPDTGCHLWTGTTTAAGYGQMHVGVHRLAWEMVNGPIPEGMQVLHRCDEPRCCNPDHLFLGTQAENMADMRRKGRGRGGNSSDQEAPRRRPRVPARRRKVLH